MRTLVPPSTTGTTDNVKTVLAPLHRKAGQGEPWPSRGPGFASEIGVRSVAVAPYPAQLNPLTSCSPSVPPASLPGAPDGVAGGHGVALPLDYKRPALGGAKDGRRSQAEEHDRMGGAAGLIHVPARSTLKENATT
jgi:hypothetical protein